MHPDLIRIGSFRLPSFGAMVLVGFLIGLAYTMVSARRLLRQEIKDEGRGLDSPGVITPEHVFDFSLGALFACIVGARLLYIALDWNEFQGRWMDIFKIWTGGITVIGALITGPLYALWFSRRHKLPFKKFADLCAPGFVLGNGIGRIGCFLNGCCYGHACDLPWGVRFADEKHPGYLTPPSHPAQLYDFGLNFCSFLVLHFWSRRPHKAGEIFLGFILCNCVTRFIDEQFRKGATADVPVPLNLPGIAPGLTHTQVFILFVLPITLFFFWRLRNSPSEPPSGDEIPVVA